MVVLVHSERDLRVLRSLAKRIDPGDAGACNNLGVVYFQKGLFEEAIEQFRRALAIDGKMEVARRNLEIAYHQTGYYDRRISEYISRLQANDADDKARFGLAEAYLQTGRTEQAISQYEILVERRPRDVYALLQLANAEKRRGELNRAIAWFEHVREFEPDRADVYYSLGEILYNQGMNAEAIAHLRKALKLEPSLPEAYRLLSFIYGEIGDEGRAAEFAARAAQLNPAAAKAQANLSLDRYSSAQYMELTGNVPAPSRDVGQAFAHYTLGIAFRARGMYDEARQEFRRGRATGEDEGMIDQAEAETELLEGHAEEAVSRYDALLSGGADSPKIWNERGVALHELGRLEDAEASYRQALRCDDRYALAWNNVGVVRAHCQDVEAAHLAFQRAIELQPELDDAQLNLGLLWTRTGELKKSLNLHRELLTRESNRPEAWNGLGSALLGLDRVDEARKAFARSVELNPKYTPARYNLSFALSRLGDHESALRETKNALELDPYYTTARYKLSIDLQYEGSEVWAPELGAPELVEPETKGVRDFDFEPTVLDELFNELEGAEPPKPLRTPGRTLQLARDYLASGLYEQALSEATQAVRAGADRVEGAVVIAEIYSQRGLYGEALERFSEARSLGDQVRALAGMARCLLQLDRLEEAGAVAEELLPSVGTNVDYLLTVGEVLTRLGDAKRAMEILDIALQQRPHDPLVQRHVARAALASGDRRRAKGAYRQAITSDPDYAAARVELGQMLLDEGAFEEAEKEIRRALELVPTYEEANLVLADLFQRQGRTREMINIVADLLAVEPHNMAALVLLGRGLAAEGRRGDAEQAYLRVLRFDPDRPEALFELGQLATESGRYRQALGYWRRLVDVAPDSEYAARARVRARRALGNGRTVEDSAVRSGA
jgi:tetratricopeptide (TPR) repeat protein